MDEGKHNLQLTDGQLIFFTEMIVGGYCSTVLIQLEEAVSNGYSITAPLLEATLRQNARDLLREPLRDPRFRKRLNTYFSRYPSEDIRECGWKWLQEVLVWET